MKYIVYQGRKLNGIVFSNEMTGGILDGQIQLFEDKFYQEKRGNIPKVKEIHSQDLSTIFTQNTDTLMIPFLVLHPCNASSGGLVQT